MRTMEIPEVGASRGVVSKESDVDEVQQWHLEFVTPDGEDREAMITVVSKGEHVHGWYTSKEYDLPAQKMKVKGEHVELTLNTKTPDGQSIEVTFRGEVDGKQVKGTAEYDLEGNTGSFPFSGSRKS